MALVYHLGHPLMRTNRSHRHPSGRAEISTLVRAPIGLDEEVRQRGQGSQLLCCTKKYHLFRDICLASLYNQITSQ